MDNNKEKLSPRVSNDSTIDSLESNTKIDRGSSIDKLLMRIYGNEHNQSIKPIKPMRYVRRFNVSVSLKNSRLFRF
jgi:hypothetical protein